MLATKGYKHPEGKVQTDYYLRFIVNSTNDDYLGAKIPIILTKDDIPFHFCSDPEDGLEFDPNWMMRQLESGAYMLVQNKDCKKGDEQCTKICLTLPDRYILNSDHDPEDFCMMKGVFLDGKWIKEREGVYRFYTHW